MADKNKLTDQSVSNIDKAIANAQARKALRTGNQEAGTASTATKAPAEQKRPRLSDEEKAAKQAERDAERAQRKTLRTAAREAKLAERSANKQPAHMKKVQKAAERLTSLGQASLLLFNEATTNLPAGELAALAQHIQHFNRVKATERALQQKLEAGTEVTVVSGDQRYVGKVGRVSKVQRIHCYVEIEGLARPAYLFTSDVVPTSAGELSTATA